MGKIAEKIKRQLIPGPHQRKFSRTDWKKFLAEEKTDIEDERLLHAGLFFDEILSFLRSDIQLQRLGTPTNAAIRAAIAISTQNYIALKSEFKKKVIDDQPTVATQILEKKVEVPSGSYFSPDELFTAAGDGLKFLLRELLEKIDPHARFSIEIDDEDISQVQQELQKAILYHSAVELWLDCIGNGYEVKATGDNIEIRPSNEALEIARTISIYRRLNFTVRDPHLFQAELEKLGKDRLKKLFKILLVSKLHGREKIEKIELSLNHKTILTALPTLANRLAIEHGYYQHLVKTPLPNYSNLTIEKIISGWQFLQHFVSNMAASLTAAHLRGNKKTLSYAPRVSRRVLEKTLSKALSIPTEEATRLLSVFLFTPKNNCDTWCQPLVELGEDIYPIIPSIESTLLLRVAEGWMRQGGLDLSKKGYEFEEHCRLNLSEYIKESSIKDIVQLLPCSLKLSTGDSSFEEIDLVIVIASKVLLVEAKCILWPDDSIQFSNYRDTIEKAALQITRKRSFVEDHRSEFEEKLKTLGLIISPNFTLTCCVLTNSAIYCGFPISDIAIVDIPILGKFFSNEHTTVEALYKGKREKLRTISFYDSADDAADKLESYLKHPPQLADMSANTKEREVTFPIEHISGRKIIYKTFAVESDIDAILKKYDVNLNHQ